ncbi:glutathione transferase GstA [Marinibaculum pumilum]|uniref:Glutathione transferase GstA n=1 Tax=Marinibaculum pumilum TaxID=1766165 RepID=A0ABV7L7F7_9PROT
MKLYYSPGACSLSPHIVLREIGLPFDLEKVNLAEKKTEGGEDYRQINPKGYVPALRLDDGDVITEGPAIVQYLADANGRTDLAPAAGTLPRTRLQEHLTFIGTELHKSFSPLFQKDAPEAAKELAKTRLFNRLDMVEQLLSDGRSYLLGDSFSAADAYLFTVANWTRPTGIGLDRWPNLAAFVSRVAGRPAVQEALKAEGLA